MRSLVHHRSSTRKDIAYVLGSNAVSTILAGAFWLLLAGLLTIENYGELSYSISLAVTLAAFGSLGLETSVMTFISKGEKDFGAHANSLALLLGTVSGLIVSIFSVGVGILVASTVFFSMSQAYLLGQRRYGTYAGFAIATKSLQILLSLLLFSIVGFTGILIGYSMAFAVSSVPFYLSLRGLRRNFISTIGRHRNFVFHTFGTHLLSVGALYIDKIVIGSIFGFQILGIYTIGSQLFLLLAMLPNAIFYYLLPQNSAGYQGKSIKRITLVFSSVLSIAGILSSPYVLTLFFVQYTQSIPVVQMFMVAVPLYSYVLLTRSEYFAQEKSRPVLQGISLFLIIVIPAQAIFGSIFGTIGLPISIVLGYGVEATYLRIWSRKLSLPQKV